MPTIVTSALIGILVLTPALALAQVDTTVTDEVTTTDVDTDTDEADLEVDLEAENLPTTNRFAFWFERVRDNIVTAFTRNAERKAEIYEEQLHRYDRKLAACAEIGDEECVVRIEAHLAKLQGRAERFITKRAELRDTLLEKFQAKAERRAQQIEDRKARAAELSDKKEELKEQFESRRDAARTRRSELHELLQKRRQNRRDNPSETPTDDSDLTVEQRIQNRETLIELRDKNVKSRLDAARQQVRNRQADLTDAIETDDEL